MPPGILVGQRSAYEIIAMADLVDLAGVVFAPGGLTALVADRADLFSNRSVPLDQVWCGLTDDLRSRMQEGSSPEDRLRILEDCLTTLPLARRAGGPFTLHPAVEFALEQFAGDRIAALSRTLRSAAAGANADFHKSFASRLDFRPRYGSGCNASNVQCGSCAPVRKLRGLNWQSNAASTIRPTLQTNSTSSLAWT